MAAAAGTSPSIRTNNQIALILDTATATKNASAKSKGINHRHGNCMKRSWGKCLHKNALGGNIRNEDAHASASNSHQSSDPCFIRRRLKKIAIAVATITPTATPETFQLRSEERRVGKEWRS